MTPTSPVRPLPDPVRPVLPLIAILALAATAIRPAAAQRVARDPAFADDDQAGLEELLAILEQETEVATKTRMNSDFVPGIVTVLQGEEMEALGKRTVWEALSLVPGLEAVLDGNLATSVVVRGIDFPFNSGNVKIMVDSVPLSRESAGINGAVLLIPIEQVERIEVIRGPGSVIYGDFAFMGLINVVTRKDSTRVHAAVDSEGRWNVGARLARSAAEEGDLRWSAQVTTTTASDAVTPEGQHASEDRAFGLFTVGRGGFSLDAQLLDRRLGHERSSSGSFDRAPFFDQTSWAAEARHRLSVGDSAGATFRVGFNHNRIASAVNFFEDQVARVGADLSWHPGTRQSLLLGLELSSSEIDRAITVPPGARSEPPAPGTMPTPPRPPGTTGDPGPSGPPGPAAPLTIENEDRNIFSLTVQDQVELSQVLTLTLGARFDDYSDIGDRVTPRLSVVWRAAERHIVKAQYAEGFRAPTFFELFGPDGELNPDLDFEVNDTTELNYVYRHAGMAGRLTLFRTDIDEMIFPQVPTFLFTNSRAASTEGVEAEWSQQLGQRWKVMANASWADTEDTRKRDPRSAYGTADGITNLALLYEIRAHRLAALHWNHVGRHSAAGPGADAYDLVDLTFSFDDLWHRGAGLRIGVDNLLDDRVFYVNGRPEGVELVEIAGRTAWLQLSWRR